MWIEAKSHIKIEGSWVGPVGNSKRPYGLYLWRFYICENSQCLASLPYILFTRLGFYWLCTLQKNPASEKYVDFEGIPMEQSEPFCFGPKFAGCLKHYTYLILIRWVKEKWKIWATQKFGEKEKSWINPPMLYCIWRFWDVIREAVLGCLYNLVQDTYLSY